ncbi:retropepsin-like aspartic protease [Sphingomonas sp. Leaf412]|uniref:retropepsin-like aspartic protease n=1 Tax=Sphingomonas sp. Leaf412 TaxID=1736370 RepID=UPI001F351F8F|nr:aspartyl protease family protein [Sphingomonas sp. Leaf412]
MRILFSLLAFLALAGAAPVATLAPDSEARWVAFDLTPGNQIRFAMTLDGRAVTAILDTGVSMSVLARRYAAAQGLAITAGGRATAIGGSVAVGRVDTATLAIGGLVRRGGTLAVVDLPAAATGGAAAVDLLVGRDLTAPFALDIDYAHRRFRFLPSGRMPFPGIAAPLSIAPDRLVYVSDVGLGGQRFQPVVVDTGDGSAVTLSHAAWARAMPAGTPATTTVSYGIAGAVVSGMAIVPELTVGRATARDVEVRIEPPGGFSDTIRVAGRIGSGFLQRYRVLLDPAAGHMLLAADPAAATAPVRSTSGLLLGVARDRLKVLHVMRGGPAAAAGWRDGEAICAIDGIAIGPDYVGSAQAGWPTAAAGRAVALRMCDGAERRLTLRRFY